MNLFTLPSRSNEKERSKLKGRFGGNVNIVAEISAQKNRAVKTDCSIFEVQYRDRLSNTQQRDSNGGGSREQSEGKRGGTQRSCMLWGDRQRGIYSQFAY